MSEVFRPGMRAGSALECGIRRSGADH